MPTTPADLLQLAPDAKSLEAGRRLFYSRRWRLLGGDGQWVWGEFDVGGKRPIESAVQLVEGRFHCTCRSRARPCAHGLALVIILQNNADRYTVGQPPDWVRSVQHRQSKPTSAAKDVVKSSDRLTSRLELMDAGVDELELRLLDVSRRGIADTIGQGSEIWFTTATRLTDAKLSGLAGRVRRLAALAEQGLIQEIARTMGDLYLFIRSWRIREELSNDRREELYQVAGINTKKEELLQRAPIADHWLVVGSAQGQEDRLRYRRVWLRGETSRRYALLLDYAFGEMPFEQSWALSASFDGQVYFYPGNYPQRGLFPGPRPGGRPYNGLKGYVNFADMLTNYRKAVGANPWLIQYPVYLEKVRPIKSYDGFLLADDRGAVIELPTPFTSFFKLLAISGGRSLALFAEFDGYRLHPLSIRTQLGMTAL